MFQTKYQLSKVRKPYNACLEREKYIFVFYFPSAKYIPTLGYGVNNVKLEVICSVPFSFLFSFMNSPIHVMRRHIDSVELKKLTR